MKLIVAIVRPFKLDELVTAHYLRRVPEDPLTGRADQGVEAVGEGVDPGPGVGLVAVHQRPVQIEDDHRAVGKQHVV